MKTIGMIGGMSWESTVTYYQLINEAVKERLGGLHSARCILYSMEFDEIEKLQSSGNWKQAAAVLGAAAMKLQAAGADFIIICTNTMHKVAGQIQSLLRIPILHIAEVCVQKMKQDGIQKALLLGTRYTMEQDFYTSFMRAEGIQPIIPDEDDREAINHVIFKELCRGEIHSKSRQLFLSIIQKYQKAEDVEAVILGCTEIPLLIQQEAVAIPVLDTTCLHALAAVELALNQDM